MDKPIVRIEDLGIVSYKEAWNHQTAIHCELIKRKRANSNRRNTKEVEKTVHTLILCEHKPVYTLGKSGSLDNLLISHEGLKAIGAEFHKINRGGDITFHGPGQVVCYPIFDLDEFFTDVHRYVRTLEQVIIDTLADYHVYADRKQAYTGVWLPKTHSKNDRKICAIGVHMSRWVTLHGFAFNVNTDLNYFKQIVPCGISEVGLEVTSLAQELKRKVPLEEIKERVISHASNLFGFQYHEVHKLETREFKLPSR